MKICRPVRLRAVVATGGGLALAAAMLAPSPSMAEPTAANSEQLRSAVTAKAVMGRLADLQHIADQNDGSRASGLPGYAASVDYVATELRAAGYAPEVQAFDFPYYNQLAPSTFSQVSPTATTYVEDTDYALMTYSASGDVQATVQPVDLNLGDLAGSTSGCEAGDFAGFVPGNIALIRRGTCTFGAKVENAQAAGASAVIVMNTGTEGRTDAFAGTLGGPVATVPALGTSFAIGESLASGTAIARVATSTESEIRTTWNVTAETARGTADNVVMAGAHLDSVAGGPGINDNGSGSAALLEVAVQMAKAPVRNKVRFAWWGAEELGLLGSEHYVADLEANSPDELDDIALYLNFDMVGSPNYALFVYDGDNSRYGVDEGAAIGPEGSAHIEQTFHDYFAGQGLPSAETPFSGRSDYGPFIGVGIPSGGLFTGAEGVKTTEEAALFGGEAGVAYDVCYHAPCDSLANVSEAAIDANSDAMAHTILTYGLTTEAINGDKGKKQREGVTGVPSGSGTDSGGGLHDDHDEPAEL
ncbi:MAG TPA: M28 family peptidase [Nocardioides sp.]|nr:M28 family peptidase [Nocardioides sp.]